MKIYDRKIDVTKFKQTSSSGRNRIRRDAWSLRVAKVTELLHPQPLLDIIQAF